MALGSRFDAHLARVTDPRPLILPLTGPAAKSGSEHEEKKEDIHLIVKLRPNLLQYIVNGRVRWTIRSIVPIMGVSEFAPAAESEGLQVLVAVVDGNVWLLTLPSEDSSAWSHTLLQNPASGSPASSQGSQHDDMFEDQPMLTPSQEKRRLVACTAKWLLCIPGIQSIYHVPSSSVTVCTSAVTPTTLVFNITTTQTLLELEELEADQSTAVICLHYRDQRYKYMLEWLFPDVDLKSKVVLLQGDTDGCVRYCIVNARGKSLSSQLQSGKLMDLNEPIHSLVPFQSRDSVRNASLDALLVVGTSGHIEILAKSKDESPPSHHKRHQQTELGTPIDCIVYLDVLDCFLYCIRGDVFALRSQELQPRNGSSSEARNSSAAICTSNTFSIKLPIPANVVRLAIDNHAHAVSLIFGSGVVSSVDVKSFSELVSQSLPSTEASTNGESGSNSSEPHIRQLLQKIAQISSQSTGLAEQSQALDQHLHRLHSALILLMHVQKHGVESIIKLDMKLELSSSGCISGQKSLKLICRIDGKLPDDAISFLSWSLYIHVRSRKQMLSTYSFPIWLHDTQVREKNITIDDSTLALHEEGLLFVDCWLVFQPGHIDRQQPNSSVSDLFVNSHQVSPNLLFSPSISVLQGHVIHLVSLNEPSREDIPSSHTAVRAKFQQANEISLPVSVNCDQTLLSGIQWWSSLSKHDVYSKLMQSRSADVSAVDLSPPHGYIMRWKHIREKDFNATSIASLLQHSKLIGHAEGLDQCCREQNGKIWVGLKTYNNNLVALRFTLGGESTIDMAAGDQSATRQLEVSIQCSDIADLSAIRAVLIASSTGDCNSDTSSVESYEHFPGLSLELVRLLNPLLEADAIVEELEMKIQNLTSADSSICMDEVLYCLSRLALVETQSLDLYWKSRQILNKHTS